MKRRIFIQKAGVGTGFLLIGGNAFFFSGCDDIGSPATAPEILEGIFNRPLPIPPAISANGATLTAQINSAFILEGQSSMVLGYYQGGILGPTLFANSGDSIDIQFINMLSEKSNIHWHGLFAPADMDGHPKDVVDPAAQKQYLFTISNRAGTYWYHPHPDLRTAKQAYEGLAGFFIVTDKEEQALKLPSGGYDIPLVIQDKRMDTSGQFPYVLDSNDHKNGLLGDRILVNGIHAPVLEISSGWYRLRLLNGSNARIYNLSFANKVPMYIIGSDGGLLQYPEQVESLLLSPGERVDMLIDCSSLTVGEEFYLQSEPFSGSIYQGKQGFNIMKLRVAGTTGFLFSVPSALSSFSMLNPGSAVRTRSFDVSNGGGHSGHDHNSTAVMHVINGKSYDEKRIDINAVSSTIEHWIFDNTIGIDPHPMHLHGAMFQVLSRTGGRAHILPHEKGWKDTVLLMPGEKVEILVQFSSHKGVYVFHCHNLEHEDSGMMLQMKLE